MCLVITHSAVSIYGPSNSHAHIECSKIYFFLCLSMVFLSMQTRSPVNSNSQKFVEMVRVKPLSLCFGNYLSLNEAEVGGRICNLMIVNSGVIKRPGECLSLHSEYFSYFRLGVV
jgi:hypothetical protein